MDLSRVAGREPRRVTGEEREAAVLVPVVRRAEGPHVLFTKRAEDLSDHPGQMSFPGGGRETYDADIYATALREGHEEIGLREEEVGYVGQLDDIRTVTEFSITPFVVEIPDRTYEPNDREVAEIAVLPIAGLVNDANHELERREHPYYGEIVIHYFRVGGYTVWGATGRIVVQFLELVTDWRAPERLDPESYG
ncbi:NUDIX hydrolase [Halalkalicoccus jeotgali]|uniref:Mut/nudix family protein n=1 Tax=Halalkalicoccus jeotgali (strain DSM 18796 / CECT 7217 / JCM 14584 / KCTC 4019 / B3) TaxID=795797 RepID=D8J8H4_HALJB|nr:CoA pyrophosphatase [Halalkalicoccus jeotgali]ADJ16220.1 Mut/nudix family protein [Halalkalicoccus jeotgali B3]ELY37295.1 Mut/nudix family protein [Halalkalicoccus jeotgali B3]